MGINGLWDVLGEGEVWHIADYAAKHFKEHKRPLRIAVDEATWRFTNLTPEQVERIRQGEPAANPVEKVILWRILRLWRLNIQLLFVWDGLRKPGKSRRRGRGGGKTDQEAVRLLHKMFDLLKVPYHQAQGEAEAECARLQKIGVVDAVWSDDGDSFMFGCDTLIKAQKIGIKRVEDHIRVYKADSIAEKLDLDADSLVLFALLAGGDYDTTGLKGCGPTKTKRVAKRSFGLAKRVRTVTAAGLPAWRHDLSEALGEEVPNNFPTLKVLEGYRNPAVSSDEQLRNLRGLREGWWRHIDQLSLRKELRQRYNFTTREYLKHIAPVFLTRALADASFPGDYRRNQSYGIHLKSTRRKKPDDEGTPAKAELTILYPAADFVEVDLSERPPDEDWDKFTAKDGTKYDPQQKVECEMLECLLQHGIPDGSWNVLASPKKRKRKTDGDGDGDGSRLAASPSKVANERSGDDAVTPEKPPPKKRRKPSQDAGAVGDGQTATHDKPAPKKRGRPPKDASKAKEQPKKKGKSKNVEPEPPTPPPKTFKMYDLPSPPKQLSQLYGSSAPSSHPGPSKQSAELSRPPAPSSSKTCIDLCDDDDSKDGEAVGSPGLIVSPARLPSAKTAHSGKMPTSKSTLQTGTPRKPALSKGSPSHAMLPPRSSAPEGVSDATKYQSNTPQMTPAATQTSAAAFVPGETIDPTKLRDLRMAALLGGNSAANASPPKPKAASAQQTKIQPPTQEVIDLT